MYRPITLALSSAISCAWLAGAIRPSPVYTIHFRPPLHRKLSYETIMLMSAGDKKIEAKFNFSMTATKLLAGHYTIVGTIDSLFIPDAPKDQVEKMYKGTKFIEVVDSRGMVLKVDTTGPAAQTMKVAGVGMSGMDGSVFGPGRSHVGDTWFAYMRGAVSTKFQVKLQKVETVNGKQIATLAGKVVKPTSQKDSRPILMKYEMSTGTMLSMEYHASPGDAGSGGMQGVSIRLLP